MQRVLAIIVAFGLLTAGASLAGAATRSGAAAPGVTKGEIKIGVTFPDLAPVREIGVDVDHGDYEKTFDAVVDNLNKTGINGRKVVPIYAPINPLGTVPAQEACVKLTEDDEVFATIGFFNGNDGAVCYTEQHGTPVLGGTITADYLARAQAPWLTLDATDAGFAQNLDALIADGTFKKGRVGVVALAAGENLVDDLVSPAFKKHKIKSTTAIVSTDASDTVAQQNELSTIMTRFETDGVKTVLGVEGAIVGVGQALEKTDYRPRIVATNQSNFAAYLESVTDTSILKKAVTASPATDFDEPSLQKCYRVVEKVTGDKIVEFPKTGEPDFFASANSACRYVALFAELAAASGKNPTVDGFGKAAEKLGSVTIPGSGTIKYDSESHGFDVPVYIFRYDPKQAKKLGIDDVNTLIQDDQPVG